MLPGGRLTPTGAQPGTSASESTRTRPSSLATPALHRLVTDAQSTAEDIYQLRRNQDRVWRGVYVSRAHTDQSQRPTACPLRSFQRWLLVGVIAQSGSVMPGNGPINRAVMPHAYHEGC